MSRLNKRLAGTARKVLAGAALVVGGFVVGAALLCALPAAASDNGSIQTALTEAAGLVGHQYRDAGENSGGAGATRATDGTCAGYVDADGDGVCDTCGGGHGGGHGTCDGYVDVNGDSTCDNCGADHGVNSSACTDFTDADGDGLCDTCGSSHGSGQGVCGGFADADGNGVCDAHGAGYGARGHHHGAGSGDGQGAGSGTHHGAGHHGRS